MLDEIDAAQLIAIGAGRSASATPPAMSGSKRSPSRRRRRPDRTSASRSSAGRQMSAETVGRTTRLRRSEYVYSID
jgi:hypothetical protein